MPIDVGDQFGKSASGAQEQQRLEEERRREERDEIILGRNPYAPKKDADTTTVTQDIGNFFRVLFSFIAGMIKGDLSEFDMLSSVYFPATDKPPAEGTQARTEYDRVQEMRQDAQNYVSGVKTPASTMTPAQMAEHYARGLPRDAGFDTLIDIFLPLEGDKLARDPHGTVAKYGINSGANPDVDVANLTRDGAIQLYRDRYWKQIDWSIGGATTEGQLSAAVKLLIFDVGANSGVAKTKSGDSVPNKMLRESYNEANGDNDKMVEIILRKRRERYAAIIEGDPKQFAQYKNTWENRLKTLESVIYARTDMRLATDVLIATPPVDILRYRISDEVHMREKHPVHGGKSFHNGTDYAVPRGTALNATHAARVASMNTYNGYGKTIVLDYGDGIVELSAHLSGYPKGLKVGAMIEPGQLYAYTGNTGTGTGAHLHHELWIKRGDTYYTVDETLARGKNLRDPEVQKMLVDDAIAKGREMHASNGLNPAIATVARNIEFHDHKVDITERPAASALTASTVDPAAKPVRPVGA